MPAPQLMVANCPTCGKVFQKNVRNQCMGCSTNIHQLLSATLDFLRRNYRASLEQVSASTGVSELQLQVWIKEGKIMLRDYPNLSYPCASCSAPIRENKCCTSCAMRLTREIKRLNEQVPASAVKQSTNQPAMEPQGKSRGFQIGDRWKHS
ncbi:flagellar protein [Paenibacillus roseipurpureus]|uniref:Flagellar protein n=1 Tax=Paenibacillus roseopurpureus TaxID=2918901 RepID=A0AA96RIR0_9BACL|nr:flagellar protein [Paenibacillus sp. MBLB1832]WNR42514.1 flagellar protein [Paenibacillus sp. MBLB1832]